MVKDFVSKIIRVKAVRFDGTQPGDPFSLHVSLKQDLRGHWLEVLTSDRGYVAANVGDWIVMSANGLRHYTNEQFLALYEPAP